MRQNTRSTSGEHITITLLPLGGEKKEVVLENDASVEDALEAGGFEYSERTEVRVNGTLAESSDIVEEGDKLVITSAGKIEGGF